jgi:Glyoxalase-like domain
MDVTYAGPEGALISADGQERDVSAGPGLQSAALAGPGATSRLTWTLLVDDLDAGEARALELGASRLNSGGERFRVFADPAGHPFCLIR